MDLVDRLFRKLRDTVGRRPSSAAGEGFTVGDLYQRLVPYRGVRGELGILELAEYEHALLRLLAGERGYLRLEEPRVAEELRKELSSPNPILGIYRDYAGERVDLVPDAELPTVPERAPPAERPTVPERPMRPEPPTVPERAAAETLACHACRAPLPPESDLRFCPACGASQDEAPCAGCGAPLRPDWNFCIRCGTPRPR